MRSVGNIIIGAIRAGLRTDLSRQVATGTSMDLMCSVSEDVWVKANQADYIESIAECLRRHCQTN